MKIYKTDTVHVISGKVKEASDNEIVISTVERGANNKDSKEVDITVKSDTPLDKDIKVGGLITCAAMPMPSMERPGEMDYKALHVSANGRAESFDWAKIAVVNGEVMFANYVDEKDENGQPKMTKEVTNEKGEIIPPHAKKPHFDISIRTQEINDDGQPGRSVLHTIKVYPFQNDTKQIDRYKKLFENFDRESNPIYASIVTQPGFESSRQKVVGDREYTNYYCNHMGIKSLDVEFLKAREKTAGTAKVAEDKPAESKEDAPEQVNAPAQTAPAAPAQAEPVDEAEYFLE